jgi:hypothetical protein
MERTVRVAEGPDPFAASAASGANRAALRKSAIAARTRGDVILVRDGAGLQFPALCPNCGATAVQKLPVKRALKLLIYDSEAPTETVHEIPEYAVPFCDSCILRHRGEIRTASRWLWLKRLFWGSGEALGGVVVIATGFLFASSALERMSLTPLILAAFPWTVGGLLLRRNWRRNRYLAVPAETSMTAAVEFTPDLSAAHEPAGRAFRFRNAAYTEEFPRANAERLWDPHGSEASQAREKRRTANRRTMWVVGTIVAAVLLWSLWDDYGGTVKELLGRWLRM